MDYDELIAEFESINICMLYVPVLGLPLPGPSAVITAKRKLKKEWHKTQYSLHVNMDSEFEVDVDVDVDVKFPRPHSMINGLSSVEWGDVIRLKGEDRTEDMEETMSKTMNAQMTMMNRDTVAKKKVGEEGEKEKVNVKGNEEVIERQETSGEGNRHSKNKDKTEENGKEGEDGNVIKGLEESAMMDRLASLAGEHVSAPIYLLTLSEPCESLYLSVLQPRSASSDICIDIHLSVIKLVSSSSSSSASPRYQYALAGTTPLCAMQGQSAKMSLDAGEYFIILTSTGCHLRQYLVGLRDASTHTCPCPCPYHTVQGSSSRECSSPEKCDSSLLTSDCKAGQLFTSTSIVTDAYTHLFNRLDSDNDGHLNHPELEYFISLLEGPYVLDDDTYKWFLNSFESTLKGMTMKGFMDLQFQTVKGHGDGCCKREKERERDTALLQLHGLGYRSTHICNCVRHHHHTVSVVNESSVEDNEDEEIEDENGEEREKNKEEEKEEEQERKTENDEVTEIEVEVGVSEVEEGDVGGVKRSEKSHAVTEVLKSLKKRGDVASQHRQHRQRGEEASSPRSCCACMSCPCGMIYVNGRAAVLTAYTSVPHNLIACHSDGRLASAATELVIRTHGKATVLQCCTMYVHSYSESQSETGGVSFLLDNTCGDKLLFSLDCSESTNICSHIGALICTHAILPGESKVIMHLRLVRTYIHV